MIHLGMSGSIRVLEHSVPAGKHEHFDLVTGTGHIIRFRDPRKFGSLLYCDGPLHEHLRLRDLGMIGWWNASGKFWEKPLTRGELRSRILWERTGPQDISSNHWMYTGIRVRHAFAAAGKSGAL